jgi:TPR repeat protein
MSSNTSSTNAEPLREAADENAKKRKRGSEDKDSSLVPTRTDLISPKEMEALFNGVQCCKQASWDTLNEYAEGKSNPLAQAALSVLYAQENSCTVKRDLEKSAMYGERCISILQQESSVGADQVVQCFFGLLQMLGTARGKNMKQANRYLKLSADQGFSIAQCHWGMQLIEKKTGRDSAEGTKYLALAAKQGSAMAQYNLGRRLDVGKGCEMNETKAIKMYELAAAQGYALAFLQIGLDKRATGHFAEAFKLFMSAAKLGCAAAQAEIGLCYYRGNGIEKDLRRAVQYFQLAADAAHPVALKYLADCLMAGKGALQKDAGRAVELMSRSAQHGNSDAMNTLGHWYAVGKAPTDLRMALRYYKQAAEKGHSIGQYNVGRSYETGRGVEMDAIEAAFWYQRSSHKGYRDAINALGNCYRKGFGVISDMKEAVRLYQLAAKKGLDKAKVNLAHCYAHGIIVEKSYDRALQLLCAASSTVKSAKKIVDKFDAFLHSISSLW